jgi:hypothetical protein
MVFAAPHTPPTDFEIIDPGEISITPEYVSTLRMAEKNRRLSVPRRV